MVVDGNGCGVGDGGGCGSVDLPGSPCGVSVAETPQQRQSNGQPLNQSIQETALATGGWEGRAMVVVGRECDGGGGEGGRWGR